MRDIAIPRRATWKAENVTGDKKFPKLARQFQHFLIFRRVPIDLVFFSLDQRRFQDFHRRQPYTETGEQAQILKYWGNTSLKDQDHIRDKLTFGNKKGNILVFTHIQSCTFWSTPVVVLPKSSMGFFFFIIQLSNTPLNYC